MNTDLQAFLQALLLQAGYNSSLVAIGAALLGAAAGAVGAFILLRRRSLASDAAGHATLPGLAIAFIMLAVTTGNGRWLPGLMIGAISTAALGLLCITLITRHTRLKEDAAIGSVLSVFFGAGVVLMTVIQSLQTGKQAGLASYLLGSAAGMLRHEAELIACMAALTAGTIFLLRRPFSLLCFDPQFAAVNQRSTRVLDLALSALLLLVVVTGLKVVGLVLSVALSVIPAVAARFWTDRVHRMVPIAALIGALGAYIGAALSASMQDVPTGAVIVLTLFLLFIISMLFAPRRGIVATAFRHHAFRKRVHWRQGLLALSHGEPIYDGFTIKLLRRAGMIRRDGVATPIGLAAAEAAAQDEALWRLHREANPGDASTLQYHRVLPIREVLPHDTVAELLHQYQRQQAAPAS